MDKNDDDEEQKEEDDEVEEDEEEVVVGVTCPAAMLRGTVNPPPKARPRPGKR